MNRFVPLLVFVITVSVGLGLTYTVYRYVQASELSRFERLADEAVDRLQERVSQHIALLIATRSLFAANGGVAPREAFHDFVAGLDLDGQFDGVQGIGFARSVPVFAERTVAAEIRSNYDMDVDVWPETDQALRTPIVLLEPFDERNSKAIGYDMYSNEERRIAMDLAALTGLPRASGPVELVQETSSQKQRGFLVYLSLPEAPNAGFQPNSESRLVAGFVYAPFRAGDLHEAALKRSPMLPVVVETRDVTGGEDSLLYRSERYAEIADHGAHELKRPLTVAGRDWSLSILATRTLGSQISFVSVYLLGVISLLFAAALAVSARSQLRAMEAAQRLNIASQKTIEEKELMLQEMKHRIKNSLARVLAIARQTAANSETLDDFTDSFSARMQAMANAQDMLTRSVWKRADLFQLLEGELIQVFDDTNRRFSLDGPSVLLDEATTQALGLTFHELATNAMKYGAMADETGKLQVRWVLKGKRGRRRLVIDWLEYFRSSGAQPVVAGFGTRLIDANIMGELGGDVTRTFRSNGMTVRISVPFGK